MRPAIPKYDSCFLWKVPYGIGLNGSSFLFLNLKSKISEFGLETQSHCSNVALHWYFKGDRKPE